MREFNAGAPARACSTAHPRSDAGKRSSIAPSSSALTLAPKGSVPGSSRTPLGKGASDDRVEAKGINKARSVPSVGGLGAPRNISQVKFANDIFF